MKKLVLKCVISLVVVGFAHGMRVPTTGMHQDPALLNAITARPTEVKQASFNASNTFENGEIVLAPFFGAQFFAKIVRPIYSSPGNYEVDIINEKLMKPAEIIGKFQQRRLPELTLNQELSLKLDKPIYSTTGETRYKFLGLPKKANILNYGYDDATKRVIMFRHYEKTFPEKLLLEDVAKVCDISPDLCVTNCYYNLYKDIYSGDIYEAVEVAQRTPRASKNPYYTIYFEKKLGTYKDVKDLEPKPFTPFGSTLGSKVLEKAQDMYIKYE